MFSIFKSGTIRQFSIWFIYSNVERCIKTLPRSSKLVPLTPRNFSCSCCFIILSCVWQALTISWGWRICSSRVKLDCEIRSCHAAGIPLNFFVVGSNSTWINFSTLVGIDISLILDCFSLHLWRIRLKGFIVARGTSNKNVPKTRRSCSVFKYKC